MKKQNTKKKNQIKIKRIKLNRNLRLPIIAIIGLIIILSAYTTYAAYQTPTTTTEKIPTYSYTHLGNFDYQIQIKNNSLYNTTLLLPGQGVYFKKLIEKINASYTYTYQGDKPANIQGRYTLEAQIQTSLWTKEYTLKPETAFQSDTGQATYTIKFPINTTRFENYLDEINNQTGVTPQDPTLIIQSTTYTSAHTSNTDIHEIFQASLQIPLQGNILNIDGLLTTTQTGTKETTIEINQTGITEQRNTWTIATIIFTGLFFGFIGITTSETRPITTAERLIRKIKKKYGDWIVETTKLPTTKEAKTIAVKKFDDLIKISEDLGKPVIHYTTTTANPGEIHTFYIFDENVHYEYTLPMDEKLQKTTRCPECRTKITVEGQPGEKTHVTCPACGNKGTITFEKTQPGLIDKIKTTLKLNKNN